MTDTQRTKAQLTTLCADNNIGAITPQILRDFIESSTPSTGLMHFHSPGVATTISAPSTFVKAANVTELHSNAYRFSQPLDNRLQYTGTASCVASIAASLSFTCAANNQTLAFAFYVNGVLVGSSKVRTRISTGTDVQAVTLLAQVVLNNSDYIEVWVSNETAANNLTIEHCQVLAIGVLI